MVNYDEVGISIGKYPVVLMFNFFGGVIGMCYKKDATRWCVENGRHIVEEITNGYLTKVDPELEEE